MTEKNKLSLEDILKYHKAKVISAGKGKWTGWIKDIHLQSKSLTLILKGYFPETEMWILISDCKLILRTIEQLTDEEIKKCHDLSFWDREGQSMEERRILIDIRQERWECSLSKSERECSFLQYILTCGISYLILKEISSCNLSPLINLNPHLLNIISHSKKL